MVNYLNDISKIEEDVQQAKDGGAVYCACTHWGDEYVRNPNQSQKILQTNCLLWV